METKARVRLWERRQAAICTRTVLWLCALAGIVQLVEPSPALADFKLCNATTSRIGVAVGYKDPRDWTTEGWWNIRPRSCETLLKGDLPSRFVYIYAIDYDRGGEWSGKSFMCTDDRSFLIRDIKDCEQRGHARTGFVEVDTRDAKDWTIRLTDADASRSNP
jgi:uncharacterized membrane protein